MSNYFFGMWIEQLGIYVYWCTIVQINTSEIALCELVLDVPLKQLTSRIY